MQCRIVLALSLMFMLAVHQAVSQTTPNVEEGVKPYGAYSGGDIDSIGMSNGTLSLHIPLISYPQRGGKIHFGFSLVYHNPVYAFTDNRAHGVCPLQNCYTWDMGTSSTQFSSATTGNVANYQLLTIVPDVPAGNSVPAPNAPETAEYYTVVDPDNAVHKTGNIASNTWISDDATGYSYNSASGVLVDRQGTGYQFSVQNYPQTEVFYPVTLQKITDVDGNFITANANGNEITSWTDTMGRTIPQFSYAGYPITTQTSDFTGCTGSYSTTSAYLWSVPGPNGGTSQFKVCYASFPLSYDPNGCTGYIRCSGLTGGNIQIQSIVLPNNTAWTFQFDTTGALSEVILPTGGTISYTWTADYTCMTQALGGVIISQFVASATSRSVDSKDGTGPHTWTYALSPLNGGMGPSNSQTVVTDPLGNDAVHTLTTPGASQGCSLYESELDQYSGPYTSGNMLKKTVTVYSGSVVPGNGNGLENVVPVSITTTDMLSGKSSLVTKTWDSGVPLTGGGVALYGDLLSESVYDFSGALLRTTNTTYMALSGPNAANYLSVNLLSLPYTVQVLNGSSNQVSLTQYNYDESTPVSSGLALQQQFAPFGAAALGNNTSVYRWLNAGTFNCPGGGTGGSNGYVISKSTYYDDGMLSTSSDPCGHTTTYSYAMTYWATLATTITNALNQTTTNTYDYNTGLVTSTTDPNNLTTSYSYDTMWRPVQESRPDGGQDVITHQESSFPFTATLTSSINGSLNKVEMNVFDGLGRVSEHQLTSDPQRTVYTDTTYDALGRVHSVSNPYRSGSDASSSPGFTTYGYDPLSRKISVTYSTDNSIVTTAYCGPSTLVTDPTGKWRRSQVDALGRLIEVDEPNAVDINVNPNGCPGSNDPIWATYYTNDALGNLLQIVQNGSHTRSFSYDSLSRLLTSTNPENGTISYAYNPDSTLLSKTDARQITTSYSYDALHRATGITYSNGDPSVSYAYDGSGCLGLMSCQNIGERTGMTDAAGSESWAYEVDRTNFRSIHVDQRTTSGVVGTTTYYLDLSGNVTQLVYPTGRVVNYTYDGADRPSTAVDGSNGITYATGWQAPPSGTSCTSSAVCYTPQGAVYGVSIGQTSSFTGLNILETFNGRLQPSEIRASSTAGTAMDITYNFVDPGSGYNAGHVNQITNNLNSNRTQTFTYDQVNRIVTAGTAATSGTNCWGYQYTYDAWGNLNLQQGLSNYSGCSEFQVSAYADGNNHLYGFSYDASGNTLADGNYIYTWNGASEMATAGGMTYSYDGDGRRASKVGNKLYWYGSGDEILAETDTSGNVLNEYVFFGGKRVAQVPASGSALYYAEDLLGSSRVIVQSNGALCYDADFTPYGAESTYTSSCSQNYKFEGKERDEETQNDNFDARMYSWRFGRWLSSDWSAVPVPVPYANLTNPQTLNLYAMVSDDPESFADLDGHSGTGAVEGPPDLIPPDGDGKDPNADGGRSGSPPQPQSPAQAQTGTFTILGQSVPYTIAAGSPAGTLNALTNMVAATNAAGPNLSSTQISEIQSVTNILVLPTSAGSSLAYSITNPVTQLKSEREDRLINPSIGTMVINGSGLAKTVSAGLSDGFRGTLFVHEGTHIKNGTLGNPRGGEAWAYHEQLKAASAFGLSRAERQMIRDTCNANGGGCR